MNEQTWANVDRYLDARFVGADPALDASLKASDAAGLPAIQVSPTQGKFLMLLARAIAARRILEIGTLGGYSAIWLARALPSNGRLVSCELKAHHAEVARSNLRHAKLDDLVEIRVGRAIQILAQLTSEQVQPFDLVFIDADKVSYPDYLTAVLPLLRPGAVIVADNVVREGRILDTHGAEADLRGLRGFLDMLATDPRVCSTALQTVGERGYDGFALAVVQPRA